MWPFHKSKDNLSNNVSYFFQGNNGGTPVGMISMVCETSVTTVDIFIGKFTSFSISLPWNEDTMLTSETLSINSHPPRVYWTVSPLPSAIPEYPELVELFDLLLADKKDSSQMTLTVQDWDRYGKILWKKILCLQSMIQIPPHFYLLPSSTRSGNSCDAIFQYRNHGITAGGRTLREDYICVTWIFPNTPIMFTDIKVTHCPYPQTLTSKWSTGYGHSRQISLEAAVIPLATLSVADRRAPALLVLQLGWWKQDLVQEGSIVLWAGLTIFVWTCLTAIMVTGGHLACRRSSATSQSIQTQALSIISHLTFLPANQSSVSTQNKGHDKGNATSILRKLKSALSWCQGSQEIWARGLVWA